MISQFINKSVIVTGASSGIGEAIALMFASRGANVTLCGRDHGRLKLVLDKAVEVSGGHKERFLTVQGDVNEKKYRAEIVGQSVDKFKSLDILIPNAGVTASKQMVTNATEETYDNIMDTNVKSVFFLVQEAVPHLEKSKGNIISVSSVISEVISPGAFLYSLSKKALNHVTKVLAVELGPRGIRANSVNPCFIPTNILRHHGAKKDLVSKNVVNIETKYNAIQRELQMKDITDAVEFLASDEYASFITGHCMVVDGGRAFGGPAKWSA